MNYIFVCILTFFTCVFAININHDNLKYDTFTVVYNNQSIDDIMNYTNNNEYIDVLNIDYHVNMYSVFTRYYFDTCDKNTEQCEYLLYDQFDACQHLLNNEGGQMFYYGTYNNNLINIEIKSNGVQVEKSLINLGYTFKGMYVIMDLIEEEKEYNNTMCMADDIIRIHTYSFEPNNFYRKMMIYILINDDKTSFCPLWILSDNKKHNIYKKL
jgi:hypothetical protein